jgi:AcrR family transcriptional regulator
MTAYTKGTKSRKEIITKSREIFNEYGIHITLSNLADFLDTTLGRVTYHFPNKDLLFIAVAQDYEEKMAGLRSNRSTEELALNNFVNTYSAVMDLQYEYRCVMRYIVSSLNSTDEMTQHLQETYAQNRGHIRQIIESYVNAGSLQPRILEEQNFEVFLFQFTNLFTNWVINFELYDYNKNYAQIKPVYMKGIISVFIPFLTEKGKNELEEYGILTIS